MPPVVCVVSGLVDPDGLETLTGNLDVGPVLPVLPGVGLVLVSCLFVVAFEEIGEVVAPVFAFVVTPVAVEEGRVGVVPAGPDENAVAFIVVIRTVSVEALVVVAVLAFAVVITPVLVEKAGDEVLSGDSEVAATVALVTTSSDVGRSVVSAVETGVVTPA